MKTAKQPRLVLSSLALSLLFLNQLTLIGPGDASVALGASGGHIEHLQEQKIDGKSFIISRTTVKASPDRVWDVLTDYEGAARIFSNLTHCKVVKDEKNGQKLVKFGAKAAGDLWKFDYTLAITESFPGRIEWKRHSGAFKANEGFWQLDPVDGGKSTSVTYAKHVDAGALIPKGLVNKTVRDTVPTIFAELAREAQGPVLGAVRAQTLAR